MAKENSQHLRQLIAQQAARMMAEDGVSDYAYAKKKAGRQLGVLENSILPSNAEIEEELKLYNMLFLSEEQPENLRDLRANALFTMELLARFNPHLTGAVLDGTAGMLAETHIHLFADSVKDVEMFLLNQQIPIDVNEKSMIVMSQVKHVLDHAVVGNPVITNSMFDFHHRQLFLIDFLAIVQHSPD